MIRLGTFFWVTGLSLIMSLNSFSQNHTLPQVTPKSPNLAAMEKYIDVPVNLSTGMIKLDIPLFSFKVGDVTIPITLNYANNGLKTDEIPTWVGLGWSLSCGGAISHQQQGLNDFDSTKGLFFGGKILLDKYFAGTMPKWQKDLFLEDIVQGNIDAEYDFYHYFLPISNGSFYFTSSTESKTRPKSDVVIKRTTDGFNITDAQGNVFFFEAKELVSIQDALAVSPDFYDNSSYYLTKIIAKNGSTVVFKYKSYDFQYLKSSTSIAHMTFLPKPMSQCPSSSIDWTSTIAKIQYLLPDSIIFPEGYIKFVHSSQPRKDLIKINSGSKVPFLDRLEIYNLYAKKIKSFQLHASYFKDSSRLKLDSLSEIGNTQVIKKWKFQYNGEAVSSFPAIFSTAKDHWGYANNNTTNTSIPHAQYNTFIALWKTYAVAYANRMSDFATSILGTLKTIEYPGGGKSEFTYEPNQVKFRKYNDFLLTPFMEIPESALSKETVVAVDVMDGTTKRDSFIVPEDGYYKIDYFYETCSDPIYGDASVGLAPAIEFSSGFTYTHDDIYGWWRASGIFLLHKGVTYSYTVMSTNCISKGGTAADERYLHAWLTITVGKPEPYQIGGCRINNVKTYSGLAVDTLTKKYIYDDSLSNISFKQYPYYVTSITQYNELILKLPLVTCIPCGGAEYIIHDESVRSLVGPVIEYGKVDELTDQNGLQGKIEHKFMFSDNVLGTLSEPYVTPINTYWRSGNLIEQNTIKGGTTKTIQTVKNSYLIDDPLSERINGLKVDYESYCGAIDKVTKIPVRGSCTYRTNLATIFNETFHPSSTTEIITSDTSQLINTTSYKYTLENHNQPTEILKAANNKTIRQKIKYAFDYRNADKASTVETKAIKNLINNHINSPIEQIDIVEKKDSQFIVGGTLTLYKENSTVIDKVFKLNIASPISVINFKFSTIDSITGALIKDQHYQPSLIFNKYDTKQNIIEQKIDNDNMYAYIWDYNLLYPIAEANNADISNIAYTSFEAEGRGGFTGIQTTSIIAPTVQAPTGNKAYQLTAGAPISKTVDASKIYIVSYWSNSGAYTVTGSSFTATGLSIGPWKYYEHTINGVSSISISGNGLIDELRLYPKGAMMTTYAYEPLIGITSQCDVNNHIIYYEYDDIARLKIIRDQNKNILKKYDYQYQFNCNAAVSRIFTKNDCAIGYKGSSVTYTIPPGKYCSSDATDIANKISNEINTYGQAYANANGSCIAIPKIYNVAMSKTFTKNDCSIAAEVGSDVIYTVPAGKYFSYISQDDANAKAQADIDANGQAYANTNGSCNVIYVKLSYENQTSDGSTTKAEVVLKFYKDYACTQPYIIKGSLPVNYSLQDIEYDTGTEISNTTTSSTITCNGASIYIAYGAILYKIIDFGGGVTSSSTYNFSLQETTGYKKASGSL